MHELKMLTAVCFSSVLINFLHNLSAATHFVRRWPLAFQGALFLLLIASVLHTLDRQGEYVSRTDFLWKAKLKVEQEEVETMRGINKVNAV